MIRNLLAVLIGFAMSSEGAGAAEVVDQSQPAVDLSRGYLGVGGGVEQKLAQTFTSGVDGDLVALRLPIVGCSRGDLVLEIRVAGPSGGPDGALLTTTRVDPALAPVSGAALHEFRLSAAVRIRAGARYAFIARMDPSTASCSYAHSPLGTDLYGGGEHFFESNANPPGWVTSVSTSGEFDLAFETVVETGVGPVAASGRNCLIPSAPAGGLPIPESLPVCRCLRDGGLREFRCALLHPDFLAIRRTPWPIDLGRPYTETWEILPLTKLSAPIGVKLEGGNIPKPIDLAFKGLSRKSVQARAVTLTAPLQADDLKATAALTYGGEVWALDRSVAAQDWAGGGARSNQPPK
jgi:hypothetical protein